MKQKATRRTYGGHENKAGYKIKLAPCPRPNDPCSRRDGCPFVDEKPKKKK